MRGDTLPRPFAFIDSPISMISLLKSTLDMVPEKKN